MYWLQCTCCGAVIRNNEEENVCHGQDPYPQDEGFGQCRECFGTQTEESPTADELMAMTEEEFRAAKGWAFCSFVDARIPILAKALGDENRAKFEALPYWRQFLLVTQMVEEGKMI